MPIFGLDFEKTKVDDMMLRGELEFNIECGGVIAHAGEKSDPLDHYLAEKERKGSY